MLSKEESKTVMVVDDDFALRQFLRISLSAKGYRVLEAECGSEALHLAQQSKPDAILLDLGLPDMSGLEVARRLRTWTWTPLLVVSVQDEESVTVEALDIGADDYLTKPFKLNELLARLRASIRRSHLLHSEGIMSCGAISLDQDRRMVTVKGCRVSLTPNEYSILQFLMQNEGRVLTHRQLLEKVWGPEFVNETQLLRVHISNLRKKIEGFESLPQYIGNEPGVGYRLSVP